jgi:hypothetical protein
VEYVRVVLCVRYVGWGVCVCSEVVVVNHLFIHKMRSQLFSHSSMLRSPLSAPRSPRTAYLLSPPPPPRAAYYYRWKHCQAGRTWKRCTLWGRVFQQWVPIKGQHEEGRVVEVYPEGHEYVYYKMG